MIATGFSSLRVTLVKLLGGKKAGRKARVQVFRPAEFAILAINKLKKKKKKTWGQMLRLVELFNQALGGKDLRSPEKRAQTWKEAIAAEKATKKELD